MIKSEMIENENRVADSLPDSFVYRRLPSSVWPYAQLARWDRPIGWWLLLWPCLWSLALAMGQGEPVSIDHFSKMFVPLAILFWIGAMAMRGAGCTWNDLADHKMDAKVSRTASRPLPAGRVTRKQAFTFMAVQGLVGLLVLLTLCWYPRDAFNTFALLAAFSSIAIIIAYPFAKRFVDWPQLVLGLAFSWGALMGWAVLTAEIALPATLLYLGSISWVIGYDTIYAHQDREDDALVGVRSTARLFGEKTPQAITVLYALTLTLFALAFWNTGTGLAAYAGLAFGAIHMAWQLKKLDIDNADQCLKLFQSNSHFGWIVFVGLVLDLIW